MSNLEIMGIKYSMAGTILEKPHSQEYLHSIMVFQMIKILIKMQNSF